MLSIFNGGFFSIIIKYVRITNKNLIKIAKTHPNIEVRKKAIFWLGQSDDPRALDAIIEIVRSD